MSVARTVCIAFAYGCPRSEVETAQLLEYFRINGWIVTRQIDEADLLLVPTCGVTTRLEEQSIRLLKRAIARLRPGAQLVITGCLAGINPQRLQSVHPCQAIPSRRLNDLDQLIGATTPLHQVRPRNDHDPVIADLSSTFGRLDRLRAVPPEARLRRVIETLKGIARLRMSRSNDHLSFNGRGTFYLRIANGCMSECSFCAIRFAAGRLVSRPPDDIVEEFHHGLAGGFRSFKLVAGDVGAYGQDIGSSFADLLRRILAVEGDYRLRMNDLSMSWFVRYRDELVTIIGAHAERFDEIGIPLQSGSDRMLQAMRREHTAADAGECIGVLRSAAPHIRLVTHVIIGFPGETEADFAQTIDLVQSLGFDRVDLYPYDDRPGTPASKMADKVPQRIMSRRIAQMRKRCHCGPRTW